jgi:hypothetical protein
MLSTQNSLFIMALVPYGPSNQLPLIPYVDPHSRTFFFRPYYDITNHQFDHGYAMSFNTVFYDYRANLKVIVDHALGAALVKAKEQIRRRLEKRAVDNFRRELELADAAMGLHAFKERSDPIVSTKHRGWDVWRFMTLFDPPGGCVESAAFETLNDHYFREHSLLFGRGRPLRALDHINPGDWIDVFSDGTVRRAAPAPPPPVLGTIDWDRRPFDDHTRGRTPEEAKARLITLDASPPAPPPPVLGNRMLAHERNPDFYPFDPVDITELLVEQKRTLGGHASFARDFQLADSQANARPWGYLQDQPGVQVFEARPFRTRDDERDPVVPPRHGGPSIEENLERIYERFLDPKREF